MLDVFRVPSSPSKLSRELRACNESRDMPSIGQSDEEPLSEARPNQDVDPDIHAVESMNPVCFGTSWVHPNHEA